MRILAVDTSTSSGSIAFLDDRGMVAEWTLRSAQTHNRRLLKTVDRFLRDLEWPIGSIDLFSVTTGPGSFTGLRIGLTTVKTLAWSLNKPYAAIPSLDALAAPLACSPLPVCTLVDAHKGEVYAAVFTADERWNLHLEGSYVVIPPDRVPERIKGPTIFCGDGWLLHQDIIREKLGESAIGASAPYHIIRASFVGELARVKYLSGQTEDPMTSIPLYVRPSEAELLNPHLNPWNSVS